MTALRHLACLVVGLVVALAAVIVHRSLFPVGLLLGVATSFAVPSWLLRSRRPRTAGSYVVGWLAALVYVLIGRPEGDYVVAGDLRGYLLLATGLALVVVGLVSWAGGRGSDR